MDIKIYIMTHKKFAVPKKEGYYPMQVGSIGKENYGYLCDDIGDHISSKNSSFCELTGLYWIWKNTKSDVAGLCHYRRYFAHSGTGQDTEPLESVMLSEEEIEQYMQHYDLIVPESGMTKYGSVRKHYLARHCITDWEECVRVLREKYPEYYSAFLWNQDTNIMTMANMVIGKKNILDQYCEWLFDILFEVEKRIDLTGRDMYQKRVFGFLSERLFRVWVFMQQLKIREENVITLE